MFVPKGNYEITVDEALDLTQSFSVVFDGQTISAPIEEFFYRGNAPKDKKALRNAIKRGIFTAFKKATGKQLAWGILTGVKPSKIVRELYQGGKTYDDINQFMKEFYYLDDDKAGLLMKTLKNQYF